MKIQSCSLLVTGMNSLRVIMIPPITLHLSFLVYLSIINLAGFRQRGRTDHEAPTPCLFFCVASKTFDIANSFSSVKTSLPAPKIMYLDTYRTFINAILCERPVKVTIKMQKVLSQPYRQFLSYIQVT